MLLAQLLDPAGVGGIMINYRKIQSRIENEEFILLVLILICT